MNPSIAAARTFRQGIHPSEFKEVTQGRAIERMPFVREYILPLSQHAGVPSVPVVGVGQRVLRGELIAQPGGYVSASLHAPVTGTVAALEPRLHLNGKVMTAIVIEADLYDRQRIACQEPADPTAFPASEFVERVRLGGLVGLGGAAFPTHVKLRIPEGKKIRWVIVNGCECEPYLTCDDRLMTERPEAVVRGTQLIMQHLEVQQGYIGVEINKVQALAALRRVAPPTIEVVALAVKYPQGAEKMLIDAILKKEVPRGGLPLDIQIVVNNVGTMAALADWFERGIPLIERVVTVSGPGVRRPRNLLVPLGTPVRAVLDYCGGLTGAVRQVVLGGPMMGLAQKSLDVPVVKGTSGILALTSRDAGRLEEYPCIRCGRCLEACALRLNPTRLAQLARAERIEELTQYRVNDCFECASCSYVCPSNIPLVHWIRLGKALVREAQSRDRESSASGVTR